jgi:hypothetical protein
MHKRNILKPLLLVLIPVSLLWAQTPSAPQGSGTKRDPFLIATLDNLAWLSATSSAWNGFFRQTADIDASPTKSWDNGAGFLPIANYYAPFTGRYDGNGKAISGLCINRDTAAFVGLFGFCKGSSSLIFNLSLVNADVKGRAAGILLGSCDSTNVVYCRASGTVTGASNAGGLLGGAHFIFLSYSSSSGSVTGSASHSVIGGLVGAMNGSAFNCYSTDSVNALGDSVIAGGFTGCGGSAGSLAVRNCFSCGPVRTTGKSPYLGGFAGGLIWLNAVNSFWDTQKSGYSSSFAGNGLTTAEMQKRTSFTEWDFDYTWTVSAGNYPAHRDITMLWPEGAGTRGDPFRISSLANLFWITQHPQMWGKSFVQTTDIDAAPSAHWDGDSGWTPIGTWQTPFTGAYNGSGKTIANMTFKRDSSLTYFGMFGCARGPRCSISWLNLTGVNFTMPSLFPGTIGAIVGRLSQNARIDGCSSAGSLTAAIGRGNFGGIAGASDSSIIANCHSSCAISAISPSTIGGLVGEMYGGILLNGYSSSRIVVDVIGKGFIGGVTGIGNGLVINCFWDKQASGIDSSYRGSGKTTSEMQSQATFGGWDFSNTWIINTGAYPTLRKPDTLTDAMPAGAGTQGDPYRVSSLENLLWLSLSSEEWNKYFRQTAPIDASPTAGWECGYGWSPVGTEETPFTGGYDGGGNVITSLTIKKPGLRCSGLFGNIRGKASFVKNVSLSGAAVVGFEYVGTVAGKADSSLMASCRSSGAQCFADDAASSRAVELGCIVGSSFATTISDCFSSGKITADSAGLLVGGLIGGSQNDKITNCVAACEISTAKFQVRVGGLIGEATDCAISRCTTRCAIVINEDWAHSGGLIGDAMFSCDIRNCSASGGIVNNGSGNEAGGLIGELFGSATVFQCKSACAITATGNSVRLAGLVCSNTHGTLLQCFSTGRLIGNGRYNTVGGLVCFYITGLFDYITNCYSVSPISAPIYDTSASSTEGSAIFGLVSSGGDHVSKCYSAGTITLSGVPYSIPGELGAACFWDAQTAGPGFYSSGGSTTAQMKTQSTYTDTGWDFTNTWQIDPILNNGYPSFRWQTAQDANRMPYCDRKSPGIVVSLIHRGNAIAYTLPAKNDVSIKIYNLKGACVAAPLQRHQSAGRYLLPGIGRDLGCGRYVLEFRANSFSTVKGFSIMR